jgi:hypothetical protein
MKYTNTERGNSMLHFEQDELWANAHLWYPAYMFNVYKHQPSRKTGSRNLMGPKTLTMIWGTYMKLVTKYQIPVINSCWEKCDVKCAYTVHSKCINDHTLRSDIFLPKCPTNLRVNTLWVWLFGRTFWSWSDVRVDIKRFFFTFLEVNMSNILWSMRICKRTFFPVCRMCGYVNTLVYFYLAPYSRQER